MYGSANIAILAAHASSREAVHAFPPTADDDSFSPAAAALAAASSAAAHSPIFAAASFAAAPASGAPSATAGASSACGKQKPSLRGETLRKYKQQMQQGSDAGGCAWELMPKAHREHSREGRSCVDREPSNPQDRAVRGCSRAARRPPLPPQRSGEARLRDQYNLVRAGATRQTRREQAKMRGLRRTSPARAASLVVSGFPSPESPAPTAATSLAVSTRATRAALRESRLASDPLSTAPGAQSALAPPRAPPARAHHSGIALPYDVSGAERNAGCVARSQLKRMRSRESDVSSGMSAAARAEAAAWASPASAVAGGGKRWQRKQHAAA